jgi:ActR/RegA family two-component response regulator
MHMRPVLLMVDDDPQVVRAIERDLRRKDYSATIRTSRLSRNVPYTAMMTGYLLFTIILLSSLFLALVDNNGI